MLFEFLFPSSTHGRVARHTHDVILVFVSVFLILTLLVPSAQPILGATYTWTQSSWTGGASVTNAVHPTDQSSWDKYTSVSQVLTGASLRLATTTATTIQTDDTSTINGFNYTGNVLSQVQISGTGSSTSVLLAAASSLSSGSGADGAITISTAKNINTNTIATGRSCADGGDGVAYNVTSLSSTAATLSTSVSSGCITTNDLVLLINLQADGTNLGNVGNYEILTVSSVSGSTVNFTTSKTKYYGNGTNSDDTNIGTATTNQRVVLQRIPQYTNVTISSGGSLTTNAWNGQKGGVLAFYASGTVTVASGGSINVTGLGFRGGTILTGQGESYNKLGVNSSAANLGGGGVPGITDCYDGDNGAGGGGYGSTGGNGPDSFPDLGGRGGATYGNSNLDKLFFGSGGGGYYTGGYPAPSGGAGGGIVLMSSNALSVSGTISSAGSAGGPHFFGLGGGAGGSIRISGTSLNVGSGLIGAQGGAGGIGTDYSCTSGGYGGVGRIKFEAVSVVGTTIPTASLGSVGVTYYSSGTYTSGAIDTGAPVSTWRNFSWSASGGQTITMKARTSATSDFASATPWDSCSNITNGNALTSGGCVTSGHQYVQYQATLSTSDTSVTPSLDSVTLGYDLFTGTGNLISSIYDSNDSTTLLGSFQWTEDVARPSGTTTTLSIRAASTTALLSAASWTNFTASSSGCSKNEGLVTCTNAVLPSGMSRYFQYKAQLDSTGVYTPTVTDVRVTYVQNAPPDFNTGFGTGGLSMYQETAAGPDLGKVKIAYSIRDSDTDVGSPANQYKVTPSFAYNTGAGWVTIPSQYLDATDLDEKTVSSSTYILYNATWDVASQVGENYYPAVQVRVTLNDNEAANNTASASMSLAIDTEPPVVSSASIDAGQRTLQFTMSDDSSFQYRVSNNADASVADGVNAISGAWQSGVLIPLTITSWSFTTTGNYVYVYGEATDEFGNTAPFSFVTSAPLQNMDIKDISNAATETYREFIAWKLYTSTSSATFSKYELYRSTDNSNYSLRANISDINANYYSDTTVSAGTTYYYKVAVVDTDGDRSDYSSVVFDMPDGQGGTDFTAPTITNASTTQLQTTWAKIIWTTNEIANSKVEYSSSSGAYNVTKSNTALVTDHSLVLESLTPNTTYYYRIKSKDPFDNEAIDNNGGGGYSFITPGGAAISAVSVKQASDRTATVTWNTDKMSDSYVVYATDVSNLTSGAGVTTVGSSATTTAHVVELTGLQPRTKYYFYVQSTDVESGYLSIDNYGGSYHSFNTSLDTASPIISNISTPVTTPNSIVVVWQTDELATGYAQYGTETGNYTESTTPESLYSIYHTAVLSDLSASTNYYYRLSSTDEAGNVGQSSEGNATTSAAGEVRVVYVSSGGGGGGSVSVAKDTTPPVISNVKIEDIGAFDAKVSFTTNEPALGMAMVGQNQKYDNTESDMEFATQHTLSLHGLKLGTKYNVQVKATDKSGNISSGEGQTFITKFIAEMTQNLRTIENAEQFQDQLDNLVSSMLPSLSAPFIGEVVVTGVTDSTAVITWPTNAKTYGAVSYSTAKEFSASSTYVTEVSESQGKSTDHKIILTGLTPSTRYHVQARAFVFPGVVGTSPDKTFATKAAKISPSVSNVKNDGLTVSWITQAETSSFVEYINPKTGKIEQTGTDDKTKNHVVLVQNLAPGTSYRIRAFGYDKNNTLVEGESTQIITKQDTVAPVISSVSVSNAFIPQRTNQLQTILTWKTDEPGTTEVYYEEGLGAAETLTNMVGNKEEHTLQHTVILPGFKTGTVYRIQIISNDTAGNVGKTPIRTIITPVSNESVLEVIIKNFEDAFGFLNKVGQ